VSQASQDERRFIPLEEIAPRLTTEFPAMLELTVLVSVASSVGSLAALEAALAVSLGMSVMSRDRGTWSAQGAVVATWETRSRSRSEWTGGTAFLASCSA
jgi:hypothetical protein